MDFWIDFSCSPFYVFVSFYAPNRYRGGIDERLLDLDASPDESDERNKDDEELYAAALSSFVPIKLPLRLPAIFLKDMSAKRRNTGKETVFSRGEGAKRGSPWGPTRP